MFWEKENNKKRPSKAIAPDRGGSSFYQDYKLLVHHYGPASLNIWHNPCFTGPDNNTATSSKIKYLVYKKEESKHVIN